MELQKTLTKENFWNRMMETYPNATKHFLNWIDEYKKASNWNEIFGSEIKFHHLPHAMQMGVWLEYMLQRGGCQWPIEDMFHFDLAEDIEGTFKNLIEFEQTE